MALSHKLSALAGLLFLLDSASAQKGANTVVFASFGDWGWSPVGGQNVMLIGSGSSLTTQCANFTLANYAANSSAFATCLDGDKVQQGTLVNAGLANVSQIAVANAMASICTAAGGCDFIINTGDNFYDLGLVNGTTDPQWTFAFQNVYTKALFGNTPFLSTLGNHDYSILNPTAAASQVAYSTVDPRWVMPTRNYVQTFKSASGAVSVQVVNVDSTPLHDRYLFSGASGGGYATDSGGPDTAINSNAVNAVINSGITTANGWTGNNLYNATNFACGNCTAAGIAANLCGYNMVTGAALKPYGSAKVPSGCKYASPEMAQYATPAARASTWSFVQSTFQSGYGSNQYQVMMSHFPILSVQQRLTPYYDNATATFAALGNAAPQLYFNGHDHIMAQLVNPSITTQGGAPVAFITTGAGGISDYGKSLTSTAPALPIFNKTTYPASGFATNGTAALTAVINGFYSAQPAAGTVTNTTSYAPDANFTQFWSEYNGFTLTTVNATFMRVDFYLVNCTTVITTGNCTNVIGPVNTQYYPAKPLNGTTTPMYVNSTVSLVGYTVSTFNSAAQLSFRTAVANATGVAASAVAINSITAPSGRHLLQNSVSVTYTVTTTQANMAAVSTAMATGPTPAQLQAAGLTAATGLTVTSAPSVSTTASPSVIISSSSASTARAATAALAAAVLAMAL